MISDFICDGKPSVYNQKCTGVMCGLVCWSAELWIFCLRLSLRQVGGQQLSLSGFRSR